MNRYSHILPNLNKSISGDSKEQSFRKSNIDYYENKKAYLPLVLKNPDEDNKFSKLLKHSSTQSIFFTLASTFLDKPKTEERKLVRSMTLKQSNADSLNFTTNKLEFLKTTETNHTKSPKIITKQPICSAKVTFPYLQPSKSLNEFLAKEKIRIESSQNRRLLDLRAKRAEDFVIEKKKHMENKQKKKKTLKKKSKKKPKQKKNPYKEFIF